MQPDNEFIDLVSRMRSAQREYFRSRDRQVLQRSKELERAVDAAIELRAAPDMFSGQIGGRQ
jgi:hypothetical protein